MKPSALVLCDDQWHPAETVRRGLCALNHSPVEFEFLTDGNKWTPALLKNFPLVVVAKANHNCATNQNPWLTTETQSTFREFVTAGGGLLLLHAGTCYKDIPVMRSVTGGAFLSHPEQCSVTVEPKNGHALTAGMDAFTEIDEHYFMMLDTTDADVFLHSRSAHGIQPAGWTRTEAAGRICALTPGHNLAVWLNPQFQNLLVNALVWTTKLN